MKKKFLLGLIAIVTIILGFGFTQNKAQAATITLRPTSRRAYYNIRPGACAMNHFYNSMSFTEAHIRFNHKYYVENGMLYTVNKSATKAYYDINTVATKGGGATDLRREYVYLFRVPLVVSHLKPGQKYRFRIDYSPKTDDFNQYHWVTERANRKGHLKNAPQVDIYLNCGTSRSHMKKVMRNKNRISASRINLL